MYCPNCGADCAESAKFCSNCGQALKASQGEQPGEYEGYVEESAKPADGRVLMKYWNGSSLQEIFDWFKTNGRQISVESFTLEPYYDEQMSGWVAKWAQLRYFARPDGYTYGFWYNWSFGYGGIFTLRCRNPFQENDRAEQSFLQIWGPLEPIARFSSHCRYPGGRGHQSYVRGFVYRFQPGPDVPRELPKPPLSRRFCNRFQELGFFYKFCILLFLISGAVQVILRLLVAVATYLPKWPVGQPA